MRENKSGSYEEQVSQILVDFKKEIKACQDSMDYERAMRKASCSLDIAFFKELRRQEDETIVKKLQEKR